MGAVFGKCLGQGKDKNGEQQHILSNAGVGELAVASTEEYIERAAALAMDQELLNLLHRNLRQMMQQTSLMDGVKYMKELEDVYENIWQEWQGQNA